MLGREVGLMLNQKNIRSTIFQCWRNWSVFFFVMEVHFERMMERLNSAEQKVIFMIMKSFVIIALTKSGRVPWRRRTQENIFVLCWFIRNNRVPPSSSRWFQDAILLISFITRQCLYMCHVGCVFNLRSIINSGLIPGGQSLSKRQTVFFLLVDPMDKNHKEFDTIDLNAPRFAQSMHKARKKHQNTAYIGSTSVLHLRKGLKCYQTRSNAFIFHAKLFQLIVFRKLLGWTLEKFFTKKYLRHFGFFPRSLKDLLETCLEERIGFSRCSTTRWASFVATQKFPIKPTSSKPRSW